MMKQVLPFILFLTVFLSLQAQDNTEQVIFDRIWQQLKADDNIKPEFVISSDTSLVANYSPSLNTVYLSEEAIRVCDDQKYPAAAKAFLIAHEIAHSIQDQIRKYDIETNFLKYDRQARTRKVLEANADLNGAFASYLAGYNVNDVVKPLVKAIYEHYELDKQQLPGYPSLSERMSTASELKDKLDRLILLFDLGVELVESTYYEASIAFFEEVLQEYQGPEVLNNLGVAYTQMALNIGGYNYEQFVYPIELEYETRLSRPSIDYGSKDLDFALQLRRSELLKKARVQFEKAVDSHPDYEKLSFNLASTLNMMGKYDEALRVLEQSSSSMAELLKAITLLNMDAKNDVARNKLSKLASDASSSKVKSLAKVNVGRLDCEAVLGDPAVDELHLKDISDLKADHKYLNLIGDEEKYFYLKDEKTNKYIVGSEKGYFKIDGPR